jgi:catechol 2,3-dioxygenase-like lactoylglutathione lyase family enzyme
MKIGHIELFVADIGRARNFYEHTLGCELVAVQAEQFIWLKLGEIELLLRPGRRQPHPASEEDASHEAASYEDASSGIVLYTNHLEETATGLEQRGVQFSETADGCLAFCDPDGHWFQLVDPESHA